MPLFSFTRHGGLLSPRPVMHPPGPYYSCLVDMAGVPDFPSRYALYFSTDHHRGEGGIWLYLCDEPPACSTRWTSYDDAVAKGCFDHLRVKPTRNPIFLDPVQGTGHTETPFANVISGTVYMTYHKNGIERTQRTLLATSSDGVNFTRVGRSGDSVVLRDRPAQTVGDGHTGYLRWGPNPFPGIAHRFVGYSLHGGGDDYHSAIWASDDALTWTRQDILTPIEGHTVPGEMILIWHEMDPGSITALGEGEFVAICGAGNRASGGVARITELYEIFLGGDGRTLTRESRRILGVVPGSDDAEELSSPCSTVIDGTYHLVYVGAKEGGTVNTVMGATGRLDTRAQRPPELPAASRTRHIYRG